jgi:YYY domain-containing protein
MIAVLFWWLAIQLCGALALPLAWRLFARLPSRGYVFAKVLGLLLASYILWLGASFHLLPNDLGGVLLALVALAGLSLWLGRSALQRDPTRPGSARPLAEWLSANRKLIVASEILLLVALVAWSIFRAYSGEIAATEKPMEFAFINGVLNSRFFPPQDPWLSGYAISYYYFGYVMLAFLMRLTGVLPSVGFNLAVALWFALVLVGAFSVVYDLVALAGWPRRASGEAWEQGSVPGRDAVAPAASETASPGRAIRWGLVGALFVGVLGNLEGVVEAAYNGRLLPLAWAQWLDIKDLLTNAPTGTWSGTGWWWWHASRVIHDKYMAAGAVKPIDVEVIDEFPFFSFLLGDLHPHVLALPFVLLAIGLALNLMLSVRDGGFQALRRGAQPLADAGALPAELLRPRSPEALGLHAGTLSLGAESFAARIGSFWWALANATGLGVPGIILYAVILGGLAFLNTWDFPIYLALAALAFGLGLALHGGLSWSVARRAFGAGLLFGAIGWLAYLPFYLGFQSQAGGLLPNLIFPTRLSQFFLMFGLFLIVVVGFLALVSREGRVLGRPDKLPGRFLIALLWTLLLPVILLMLMLALAVALPQGRALINDLLGNPAVRSLLPDASVGSLVGLIARVRLGTPWTYLLLAALIAWVLALLWRSLDAGGGMPPDTSTAPEHLPVDLFAVLLIALALLLTVSVEFVYLKDFFGTRMNTVFKFYYQAWILLALASAYGLSRLAQPSTPVALRGSVLLLAVLLGAAALVYPLLATPSKAGNFQGQPALDGLTYLGQSDPGDMAAINWLRQNVAPSAVVLEAPGGSYSSEGAERVSMSTGNPTLLGWDFHEVQWRGKAYDQLTAGRKEAIDAIYRTARPEDLPALLDKWHVNYVFIGDLERRKYGISEPALARFDRAGLKLAYDANGVKIYAR